MPVTRRRKSSPEFSMASLTDIIFLLLIFFMLTSNFVDIKPFELPTSDSKTVAPKSIIVSIEKTGTFFVEKQEVTESQIEAKIQEKLAAEGNPPDFTVTIAAEVGTEFDYVIEVMKITGKLGVKTILATQPTQG